MSFNYSILRNLIKLSFACNDLTELIKQLLWKLCTHTLCLSELFWALNHFLLYSTGSGGGEGGRWKSVSSFEINVEAHRCNRNKLDYHPSFSLQTKCSQLSVKLLFYYAHASVFFCIEVFLFKARLHSTMWKVKLQCCLTKAALIPKTHFPIPPTSFSV